MADRLNRNMHFMLNLIASRPSITGTEARRVLAARNGKPFTRVQWGGTKIVPTGIYGWYFYSKHDMSSPVRKGVYATVRGKFRYQPANKDLDNYWRNDGLTGMSSDPLHEPVKKGWYLTSAGIERLHHYNVKAGCVCPHCNDRGYFWSSSKQELCSCPMGSTHEYVSRTEYRVMIAKYWVAKGN